LTVTGVQTCALPILWNVAVPRLPEPDAIAQSERTASLPAEEAPPTLSEEEIAARRVADWWRAVVGERSAPAVIEIAPVAEVESAPLIVDEVVAEPPASIALP